MKAIKLTAFAKVNLSLNITGKTPDGMHELDGFMMSVDKFDTLTVAERDDKQINVSFIGADVPFDNTARAAALAVSDAIGCNGVDITVHKGIPIGAGMGGSSADGAAVLRALDLFYGLTARGVNVRELALKVGSDVPFMLTGGLARVRGVGDDLFFIENKLRLFMIGLMDGAVSSAQAYAEFDGMYGGAYCPTDNERMFELLLSGDAQAVGLVSNALAGPAEKLCVGVEKCESLLRRRCDSVSMTGSGGTVVGYFTDLSEFARCAAELKNEKGFSVFAPTKVGILHEWIAK